MRKEKIKFFILFLFIISSFILFIYFDLPKKISVDGIKEFIQQMGTAAPLVYILIYILTSMIIFPSFLLSMSAGAMWGPYLGTFYTIVGATLASILPFLISKKLGREFVMHFFKNTKMELCDRFISKNGFLAVLIMRLIPLFAWEFVNYGSGLCGIRMRDYLLATFLGTIPASFAYNLIGASFGKPVDMVQIILIFSMVSIIALLTIFYKVFFSKKEV